MDLLFLPAAAGTVLDADSRVYWQPARGRGIWQTLADCADGASAPVALVLPAEVCSFFAVALPTRKARWVEQATAYAVEELLAENVDELHLARGELLEDGRHRVAAVRKRLLANWIGQLRTLGFEVGAIHVDADLLPRDDVQLLFFGHRALLGGGIEARMAFDPEHWPQLAEQLAPPRHAHGSGAEAPESVEDYHRLAEPYHFLADGRLGALDLAQGDFALRRESAGLARWKPVAAVLAVLVLAQWGLTLGQTWYFRQQGEHYADNSQALYRELFPQERRIVNLRAQFDQHLSAGNRPAGGFLQLLDQAAAALGEDGAVRIEQLQYDEQGGTLALQVSAPDFAALEQFRQRLGASGRAVQLGSASRAENGVSARVTLGG